MINGSPLFFSLSLDLRLCEFINFLPRFSLINYHFPPHRDTARAVWAKSDDHRTRRESKLKLEAQLAARNTMSLYLLHINSMLAVCTRIINMPRGNGTGELLHAADRAVLVNE